jgi:hypothetical protein
MRGALLVAIGLLLAACASERTVLVNSQGDQLTCETGGAGFFGAVSVANQQDKCVADAEQRGYRVK